MKVSPRLVVAAALIALASSPAVARADQWDVSGTLQANPLRIESLFATYKIEGPADLVQRLGEVAGMGRSVSATVESDASGTGLFHQDYTVNLVSVSGHTTAPTTVLESPSAGAKVVSTLDPETDFTVKSAGSSATPSGAAGAFYQVQLKDGTTGYVPASFTSIGEDHTVSRAVASDVLGPIFAKTSADNDARTFHPDGFYFEGKVTSLNPPAPFATLAQRMLGSAVVRPSLGVHKAGTPDSKLDIPGFTIRLVETGATVGPEPSPGDENFTFLASLKSLADIAIAPFLSNQFDYFDPGNTYYPAIAYRISPTSASDSEPTQNVWLRVVPEAFTPDDASLAHPTNGDQRDAKLLAGVKEHKAALRIEVQLDQSLATKLLDDVETLAQTRSIVAAWQGQPWTPLVRISMDQSIPMDNEAFRYYPDLAGRGLVPQGVVNALRAEVYPKSQAARPATTAEREADDAAKAAAKAAKTPQAPEKGIVDELPQK